MCKNAVEWTMETFRKQLNITSGLITRNMLHQEHTHCKMIHFSSSLIHLISSNCTERGFESCLRILFSSREILQSMNLAVDISLIKNGMKHFFLHVFQGCGLFLQGCGLEQLQNGYVPYKLVKYSVTLMTDAFHVKKWLETRNPTFIHQL